MQNLLTCAIVDDDSSIVRILESWLRKMPDIEVKGTFSDSLSVMQFLAQNTVDFLLLDVEMGESNGFKLLDNLATPPQVIIITAHKDHAVTGFEYNVTDYIVKPVSPERLVRAINRVRSQKPTQTTTETEHSTPTSIDNGNCLMVKENRRMVRIRFDDILYVEADRDYCKIITPDRTINTKYSIGDMANDLPANQFIRIHRSFIVSIKHIDAFGYDGVEIRSHKIPLGRLYREDVLIALEKIFGVKR